MTDTVATEDPIVRWYREHAAWPYTEVEWDVLDSLRTWPVRVDWRQRFLLTQQQNAPLLALTLELDLRISHGAHLQVFNRIMTGARGDYALSIGGLDWSFDPDYTGSHWPPPPRGPLWRAYIGGAGSYPTHAECNEHVRALIERVFPSPEFGFHPWSVRVAL
jgi:hypothetical protein